MMKELEWMDKNIRRVGVGGENDRRSWSGRRRRREMLKWSEKKMEELE